MPGPARLHTGDDQKEPDQREHNTAGGVADTTGHIHQLAFVGAHFVLAQLLRKRRAIGVDELGDPDADHDEADDPDEYPARTVAT